MKRQTILTLMTIIAVMFYSINSAAATGEGGSTGMTSQGAATQAYSASHDQQ